jgi:hypothetical protein
MALISIPRRSRAGFQKVIELGKPVDTLSVSDLERFPVWRFVLDEDHDETWVRPVRSLPVSSLRGAVVGTPVLLADGSHVWGMLGNVDVANMRLNRHLLTLSLAVPGGWANLARYHDPDAATNGPARLAATLGRSIEDVFPIRYDLRTFAVGIREALVGEVSAEPIERLSRADVIALAVP